MDNFQKFTSQIRGHIILVLIANNLILLTGWWLAEVVLSLTGAALITFVVAVPLLAVALLSWISTRYITQPTRLIWQAILHIAPEGSNVAAPDIKHVAIGKDLVVSLVNQVYQLASVADTVAKTVRKEESNLSHDFIANSLPLPLFVMNDSDTIVFANKLAGKYLGVESTDLMGQNFYNVVDMAFTNEQTFDVWLKDAKANKAVAAQTWERVRLNLPNKEQSLQPQFDLAAYYNRNNLEGYETMVVMFDHTNQYSQDDQAMSFVALAVHELRTPLTLLRGYIEAFQEELAGKIPPELEDFMKKMAVSAGQLSTFVNTILNVSRIDNNQLELQLHKASWADILQSSVANLRTRAEVRGITLDLQIDGELPPVGVDRVSITEVLNNLVDNAIKYSGSSDKIVLHAYVTRDGAVETTIQDFGVGIPESAVPHIFEKFYRNHRNRAQVGGTGLGLYLAKVIVGAHGGHIWVRSHEGEGTTFGFTILPYTQVAGAHKNGDNESADIVRSAHGWIKNHSMYRR